MDNSAKERVLFWVALTFLLLSGASALIYQVTWVRLLGLSIGATSLSISIVLAAFFLGVGSGSYFAGAILDRLKNPLKLYIFAELFVAISALALLPILLNLDSFVASFYWFGEIAFFKFFMVLLLLAIPTFFIGTTFHLIVALTIQKQKEIGEKIAKLYAVNTLGALLGVVGAGFLLIPFFGLDKTIYIAAFINLFIAICGFLLKNLLIVHHEEKNETGASNTNEKALIILFVTGFASIATEVGWMKYLIIYTNATIYGFSMILGIFLAGIIIGSWFAKSKFISNKEPEEVLLYGLFLLAAALILARSGLGSFAEINEYINNAGFSEFITRWSKYLVMLAALFPATFLFGVLFPISLKLYCADIDTLHKSVGKGYGINIIAGIFGSITAGFFIIPYFNTDILLVLMAIFVALASFVFINKTNKIKLSSFAIIFAALLIFTPSINYASMVNIVFSRGYKHIDSNEHLEFLKEGKSKVVAIFGDEIGCVKKITSNGMNESWVNLCNDSDLVFNEFMLGVVPYALTQNPKNAFVLGYGGGTTAKTLLFTNIKEIDLVELEPLMVEAMRTTYGGVLPTDNNPKINITYNDARNTLITTKKEYDIIISHPSHPWLLGVGNILSKEFFEISKSRLTPNGIHAQWVALFRLDRDTLKSILKTYTQTFEFAVGFVNYKTYELLLFGSQKPIVFDNAKIQKLFENPSIAKVLNRHQIHTVDDFLSYFLFSKEKLVQISKSGQTCTDTNILTEVFFSKYKETNENNLKVIDFLKENEG
ncbi:MAG: hypothetical protein QG567_1439 [Campylobacterota bacterium]|nr:hypothetical protein [Campylobacterota bacterium]